MSAETKDGNKTQAETSAKPRGLMNGLRRLNGRFLRWYREHKTYVVVGLLIVAFFVAYFWDHIFYSLEPGQKGVRWDRFVGTELRYVYLEGLHAIAPWDKMYIYDTRIQEEKDTVQLLSRDGLPIDIAFSMRYKPQDTLLPQLHQRVGPDYCEKLVRPTVIESMRMVIGNYTVQEVFASDERGLLAEIDHVLLSEMADYPEVIIDEVLLTELKLPRVIEMAIQDKLEQEQRQQAYRYRIMREREEKERKIIEARGIAEFEDLAGISILKWRALEVTEELAKSPNSKLIVVGTKENDLPVLLNAGQP